MSVISWNKVRITSDRRTGVRKGAQVLEGPITITEEEYRQLEEVQAAGAEIYLQQTVQSKSTNGMRQREK